MTPTWPREFDREQVRAWIEEQLETGLSVDDSFPDTLIATAQSLDLKPITLKLWIYDQPKAGGWTVASLGVWARRMGFLAEEKTA